MFEIHHSAVHDAVEAREGLMVADEAEQTSRLVSIVVYGNFFSSKTTVFLTASQDRLIIEVEGVTQRPRIIDC